MLLWTLRAGIVVPGFAIAVQLQNIIIPAAETLNDVGDQVTGFSSIMFEEFESRTNTFILVWRPNVFGPHSAGSKCVPRGTRNKPMKVCTMPLINMSLSQCWVKFALG